MESAKRLLYLSVGFVALGLGIIGAFLPLLPTTVFILLAAWAFAQSSERFHRMLLEHQRFGPIIHRWQNGKCISRKTKVVAVGSIIVTFAISIYFVRESLLLILLLLTIMFSLLAFIWPRNEIVE